MAFTGITATEDEIDQKSGANVSSDFTDVMKTASLLQAESYLNSETRFNWSDWYATTPNVDIKYIVTSFTASWVATDAINYDVDAIGRGTANQMLNVLANIMSKAMETLKNASSNQAWMVANA